MIRFLIAFIGKLNLKDILQVTAGQWNLCQMINWESTLFKRSDFLQMLQSEKKFAKIDVGVNGIVLTSFRTSLLLTAWVWSSLTDAIYLVAGHLTPLKNNDC